MNIIKTQGNFGGNVYYMKLSLVKGRNLLIKNGWKLCSNPNYLTNGLNTGHYNKVSKLWYFDNNKIGV
tara:strand:+ start:429 stop:632 length:204 start_codon:yes stop_codon:yes gene_type:complete